MMSLRYRVGHLFGDEGIAGFGFVVDTLQFLFKVQILGEIK